MMQNHVTEKPTAFEPECSIAPLLSMIVRLGIWAGNPSDARFSQNAQLHGIENPSRCAQLIRI
jgi:hypothetical protein